MEKNNLNRLLDSVYELEALIQFAMKREDSFDEIMRLIDRKLKELVNIRITGAESEEAAENLLESLAHISPSVENVMGEVIEDEIENKPSKENEEENNEVVSDEVEEYTLDSLDPYAYDDTSEAHTEYADENKNETKPRGRLVFSINDKYRFKKELFGGSDADFNTTLAFVASMDNYMEAEEYFIDELGLDPKHPVVADFLQILEKYFN